jgi:hypothetical protein
VDQVAVEIQQQELSIKVMQEEQRTILEALVVVEQAQ